MGRVLGRPGGDLTNHAKFLWLLMALFACRVAGQAAVAFLGVTWLPPMRDWYSGLLAYPLLLPSQLLILALMLTMNLGVQTGRGPLATVSVRTAKIVTGFALGYFAVMVIRFAVFGGSIPVFFHWLLALYLYIWAHHHLRRHAGAPA